MWHVLDFRLDQYLIRLLDLLLDDDLALVLLGDLRPRLFLPGYLPQKGLELA